MNRFRNGALKVMRRLEDITVSMSSSSTVDINAWYFRVQWDLVAYMLGFISSILYFAQICLIFPENVTYNDYMESDLVGMWAALIGILEALGFIAGWSIGKYYRHFNVTNSR